MAIASHPPSHDRLWATRWLLLAQVPVVLAGLAIAFVFSDASWDWSLFVWAVVVSLAGAAVMAGLYRWALAQPNLTDDQRTKIRQRLIINTVGWISSGFILGGLSVILDTPWLIIATAIYVVILLVMGIVVRSRIRDALQRKGEPDD